MLLTVDHLTRYSYEQPVRGVVQSHRLTPTICDMQKVLEWTVTVTDGKPGGGFRDGAGDWVSSWSVPGPVQEICVHVKGRVESRDTSGVLRGLKAKVRPEVYLRDTAATRADEALRALAEAGRAKDCLEGAHALMAAVAEAVAYRPGSTEAHTSAAEALSLGEGVCQDHAQIMVACARILGLPARYVSGYLHAMGGEAHEAAHAWAELYIEGLGWVGFDPANSCSPDDRYIRLGSGLDALDAAPIRGIARGPGAESLDVTVTVVAAQQ